MFKAPKSPVAAVPVVSTDTAAVLWINPMTGVTVPEEGPLIVILPANHAVEVVKTSEIVRYVRVPSISQFPAVAATVVKADEAARAVPNAVVEDPGPW